ncbi:hypothetical protein RJ639_020450 [Escallonia herrerae]|uniref:Integrase zinc-binding domain-containing protein n=1 Tax=Escallonia herrerae TaxID=1293975 RepID=A0AA89AHY9_9ASTE|nr:hypothetical protein RJ639_020450 [Escallonia herrerae]
MYTSGSEMLSRFEMVRQVAADEAQQKREAVKEAQEASHRAEELTKQEANHLAQIVTLEKRLERVKRKAAEEVTKARDQGIRDFLDGNAGDEWLKKWTDDGLEIYELGFAKANEIFAERFPDIPLGDFVLPAIVSPSGETVMPSDAGDAAASHLPGEDQPLRKVLLSPEASERLVNWSVELGEFDLQYKPRTAIKAQALADFIVECTLLEDPPQLVISEVIDPWNLYVDGSSAVGSSGARIILISPEAARYALVEGTLYKKSFSLPYLRCLRPSESLYALQEVHEGICGQHLGGRTLAQKILRQGYYWPTMQKDAIEFTRRCDKCQKFAPVSHTPVAPLTSVVSPIPFATENMNRSILQGLKKKLDEAKGAWVDELPKVLWAYRTTSHSVTEETPFSLCYGTEAMLPIEIRVPTIRALHFNELNNEVGLRANLDLVEEAQTQAHVRSVAIKQRVA